MITFVQISIAFAYVVHQSFQFLLSYARFSQVEIPWPSYYTKFISVFSFVNVLRSFLPLSSYRAWFSLISCRGNRLAVPLASITCSNSGWRLSFLSL